MLLSHIDTSLSLSLSLSYISIKIPWVRIKISLKIKTNWVVYFKKIDIQILCKVLFKML